MSILFRYILREFMTIFLMCFAGLMTVYLVVDFFERLRMFLRHDTALVTMIEFLLLRTPSIAIQMAPMSILMATLLTLGQFSRSHEITAMRSCGISLSRVAAPFLFFSLLSTSLLFALASYIAPLATLKAELVKVTHIEKKLVSASLKSHRPWIQVGNHTIVNIDSVEAEEGTLHGVTLYQLGGNFHLMEMIDAQSARYEQGQWVLHQGTDRRMFEDGRVDTSVFESKSLALDQTPEDFTRWISTKSDEMTLADLKIYAEQLQRDGYQFTRFLTDYHQRIAYPFVSIVMVVVGIALGLRQSGERRGGIALGIGQALIVGFLYWTTNSIGIALGRSGAIPALMAAWIAPAVFLSFGGYLLLKVRH
jgi:lipopolysaccharide export system permease protein